MRDIQNEYDDRGINVKRVGITGLSHPTTFDDGSTEQAGICDIEMTVALPHDRRGTHMSRMVELARDQLRQFDPRRLPIILKGAAHHLDVNEVQICLAMPFATCVKAPASGSEGWQVHNMSVRARLDENEVSVETTVTTDVTSLCPCSKAISDYGAHNQRSVVSLTVVGDGDAPYPIPVADLVAAIRATGSAPVFPVVKRPDERVITMKAYDEPAFVEDMVRDLSLWCRDRGLRHRVQVRNIESIHSHDAIAVVDVRGFAG